MARVTEAKLVITHDHTKKTARPVVTGKVKFSKLELCLMKACPGARWFRLKCRLFGADPGADERLYTYSKVKYFPDATPREIESFTFGANLILGEGVLDEDISGRDEVYGKLYLRNLNTTVQTTKKTNTVRHYF